MEKKVKFKVKRVLSCKNKQQDFFVEAKENRRNGFKVSAFYLATQKRTGAIRVRPLAYKTRKQAAAAVRRLDKRINRPLPEGISLMGWLIRESAKIANRAK